MHPRRLVFMTALTLLALISQFVPFRTNAAAASRCDAITYVADVTVPDGSVFNPGAVFTKTWRLKNTGSCTWSSGYSLVFVSGAQMGAASSVPMPVSVAPGAVVDISLSMTAPAASGSYRSYWMLKNASGVNFGIGTNGDKAFWVDIKVYSPPTPTATVGANSTGILLKGTVRRNTTGVRGVNIYLVENANAYPGFNGNWSNLPIVATTDANGKYSAFIPLAGGSFQQRTVFSGLTGYSFEPAIAGCDYAGAGIQTCNIDFWAAPGTPLPFPWGGAAYDFGYRGQESLWYSAAGQLTYPGVEGDARGFVRQSGNTTFEDGSIDKVGPNLVVAPQSTNTGYIQGIFSSVPIYKGYRFRTSVGCAYGWDCSVIFKIEYRIGAGPFTTLWSVAEKNDGQMAYLDRDLSFLAGNKVTFYLTVLANGSSTGDRAIWNHPRIVQTSSTASEPTPVTPLPDITPPSVTPDSPPSVTPPPPFPPAADAVFDFTADVCSAKWKSGASYSPMPCPSVDGSANGFILRAANPVLETGATDSGPGLIVAPQNKYNGYIQGFYPEYTVQPGDHFKASVGCAYGSSCYVTYRLDYMINNGPLKILWSWKEANEGKIYQLDKDLSSLVGKKVSFVLTVLATGPATGDRVIWGQPRITRAGYVPPTPIPPTLTPATTWLTYTNPTYGFQFNYPTQSQLSNQANNFVRIDLPFVAGTNLREKYLEVVVVENASSCHSSLASSSMPTSPETVTIAGLSFVKETAMDGGVGHLHEWIAYSTLKGSTCVSLDFILHSLNPGGYATPPMVFDAAAERAIFETMVSSFSWLPSTPVPPTPTPTETPIPAGTVTNTKSMVNIPPYANCAAGSLDVLLVGSITTNGPLDVTYHWEFGKDGVVTGTSAENTVTFTTASTLDVSATAGVGCGNYFARLLITSPTPASAQVDFPLADTGLLPAYDFNSGTGSGFELIGSLTCDQVKGDQYTWIAEPCNGESGGCLISTTPLFGRNRAGYLRYQGNRVCNLNLP